MKAHYVLTVLTFMYQNAGNTMLIKLAFRGIKLSRLITVLVLAHVSFSCSNAEVPQVKNITFSVNIDPSFSYLVAVNYIATKDSIFCKRLSVFGGLSQDWETLYYYLNNSGDMDAITFPINELHPDSGCAYIPRNINLIFTKSDGKVRFGKVNLNLRKSSTTSAGIPIEGYKSDKKNGISIQCREVPYSVGDWYCRPQYWPTSTNKILLKKTVTSDLTIFQGLKDDEYPYEREDIYWFDVTYLPAQVVHSSSANTDYDM